MALTPTREHPMFDFIKTQISQNENAWLVDFLNKNPAFNVGVLYDIYCDFASDFIEVDHDAYFTLQEHVLAAKEKQHVYPSVNSSFLQAVNTHQHDLALRLLHHYPVSDSLVKDCHRIYAKNGNEHHTLELFNYLERVDPDAIGLDYIREILLSAMLAFQHKLTLILCEKLVNHPDAESYDPSPIIMNAAACGMMDIAEDLLVSHREHVSADFLFDALRFAYEESEKSLRIQSNFAYLALPLIDELPTLSKRQLQLLFPDIDDHVNALTPDMPEKDILYLICIHLKKNEDLTPLDMLPRVEEWLQPYYLRFLPL